MKSFILAGITALFLVGGAIGYMFFVNNTTDILSAGIEKVETAVKNGDFDSAKRYATEFDKSLEERKTILCAIVDHKEINEIKRSLAEFDAFLDNYDGTECLAKCGEISAIVNRISDNTMPYISNVL